MTDGTTSGLLLEDLQGIKAENVRQCAHRGRTQIIARRGTTSTPLRKAMSDDHGKKKYVTYIEAQREAERLTRAHRQGFQPYRVGSMWAVGGMHVKKVKTVKSLGDLHQLLDPYKDGDVDASVDAYISDIANEGLFSESEEVGAHQKWVLLSAETMRGCDIGMSPSNMTVYLVLTLKKSDQEMHIKMGGKFAVHIPVVKRQCEKLLNKSVRWHTWNSATKRTNWSSDEWFYLIEEDADHE